MTRDEIAHNVRQTLAEMFELDAEGLTMEVRVVEDLDLDSIDAIDMAVRLEERTGLHFEDDDLKSLQTIRDIVDKIDGRI